MFTLSRTTSEHTFKPVIAFAAALVATTIALGAAAGPAMANPTRDAAVSHWMTDAEKQIDSTLTYPRSAIRNNEAGIAEIKLNVAADGSFQNPSLTKSTGNSSLDKEALRVAKTLAPLPDASASKVSAVMVRVGFAIVASPAQEQKFTAELHNSRSIKVEVLDQVASL